MDRRFFRHGELHLVLLALLAERPMHGYELMGELATRFGPAYRPSAGSVYPALESLGAEDLIEPDPSTQPTNYRLTPAGMAALTRRSRDVGRLSERTGVALGTAAPVEAALTRLSDIARRAARLGQAAAAEDLLIETSCQLESLIDKETS